MQRHLHAVMRQVYPVVINCGCAWPKTSIFAWKMYVLQLHLSIALQLHLQLCLVENHHLQLRLQLWA